MFTDQKIQNSNRPNEFYTKSDECIPGGLDQFYSISENGCSSCSNIAYSLQSFNSKNYLKNKCSLATDLKDEGGDLTDDPDSDSLHYNKSSLTSKQSKNNCNKLNLGSKLQDELLSYKRELREYNNTTRDLEEKYKKLNIELSEMQKSHERFISSHKEDSSIHGSISLSGMNKKNSDFLIKDSSRHSFEDDIYCPFHYEPTFSDVKEKRSSSFSCSLNGSSNNCAIKDEISHTKILSKINESAAQASSTSLTSSNKRSEIKDFYAVVQSVLNYKDPSSAIKEEELKYLQTKVKALQTQHAHFQNIIDQQKDCLRDYHSRCLKAQFILKSQQVQIEKLNSNNHQLESEITKAIDDLRTKIDTKLKDISKLPQIMKEEQLKYEKISKENQALAERLKNLQEEAVHLKLKVEELAKKKTGTINRLKTTERDLKIFKNYNVALKHEKRRLCDELQKVKDQLDSIQHSNKRTLFRQREQSEKQRRDLQKRLFELELKISRSKSSTTNLIQERDNLIAELQTQLNTLVHNFEVSQKHIRVLRRHIYSMTGSNPI